MDLWKLFLTPRQEQKLNLLEEIISKKEVSLDELAYKNSLTNRKLKIIIEQINSEYDSCTKPLIKFENRMFKLTADESEEVYSTFYLHLKQQYINQSSVFKLLLFFLEHRKIGMIRLSRHFNYSQSYCYKLINKANEIIKVIGFNCEIRKKTNYIVLEGNENQIRVITYLLETTSITFNSSKNYNYLTNANNFLSSIHQDKLKRISKVFDNSLKLGQFVKQGSEEELEVMASIYKEVHLGFFNMFSYVEKDGNNFYFLNEKMFFYLFTIYYLPEYLTPLIRNNIGENLANVKGNRIIDKATKVLKWLEEKYEIPKEFHNTFLFQLVYRFLITDKLSLNILFYATNSITYTNENIKEISSDFQNLYKDELSKESLEVFSFQVTELLYSYLGSLMANPLKVSINSTYRANYVIVIRNSLSSIYKEDTLKICEKIEESDVVISDSVIDIDDSQDFFFLDDIHDLDAWRRFGEFIHEKILQRRIHLKSDLIKIEDR
ncbi:hypothetical protein ENLAB_32430 [Enterococcus innesii]|uniref:Mga helix-turn-helix domain-containing protein n=1 Tax=Enterococcus innesii TaxID=2839759 RepID=A0ABM7XWY1_9ENTE|nr:helix-turn-helix domain-containing protein [Enterococcus innesii]BDG69679.1 hypothetical protein ENLAB_32430 [Enterococcus innesii]